MVDQNRESALGAQGLSDVIHEIVAGHEKNELFTKLRGSEPYAAELNELIDCVNEELEYQRFRLRTVNEAVNSGMWYMKINPDFSIAYAIWSDEFRRMVGFRGESDFPNTIESWSSRLHPDDVEETFSSFNACIKDLSGNTEYNADYRLKVHDGSYRWFHASGNVVRDKSGHPEEIIGVFVDIDEEKRKTEVLAQTSQKKEKFYGELETMLSSLYASIDAITTSVSETTERTVEISSVQEEITQAAEDTRNQTEHTLKMSELVMTISKQTNLLALNASIEAARAVDPKVLVESGIVGREVEVAVLQGRGDDAPRVAEPGEIAMDAAHGAGEFYDYETKYLAHDAVQMVCPARITPAERELLMATASAAFDALGGEGLMRVDFFLTPRGEAVVNEVNTMPGFTPFSMYPYMWQVSGLGYTELVTELIDLALERPRDVNR